MNKFTIRDGATTFTRISKVTARKLWGKRDIAFCPVNLRPGFPWAPNITFYIGENEDFDNRVSSFEWYNCSDSETGRYTAFYLVHDHHQQTPTVANRASEQVAANPGEA